MKEGLTVLQAHPTTKMSTSTRLSSQVSTDAAPMTPRAAFSGESMNFPDNSCDAIAGPRYPGRNPTQGQGNNPPPQGQGQNLPPQGQSQQNQTQQGQEQTLLQQRQKNSGQGSLVDIEKSEAITRDKIKGLSLNFEKDDDSSYSSIGSISSSSMPSLGWEEELKKYEKSMPARISLEYFDALILYAEEDREKAEDFKKHLINEIDIGVNGPVTAMLYDCPELIPLSGSMIGHLALAVERSTYVFMYLTDHFVRDKWMEFSSESCLMTAIYDVDKRWCVVPVYTQKRSKCTFKIPMGLNSLKGINYYNNDEFYRRGVARLILDKVPQRKQNNENHKIEQKKWLENFKREQAELQEKQKRTELFEEQKTAEKVQMLKDVTERMQQTGMHYSHSEGQLSTPNHSLPQFNSESSFKDVHPQNPAVEAYVQDLYAQSKQALQAHTADPNTQNYIGQPRRPVFSPENPHNSWHLGHGQENPMNNRMGSTTSSVQRDNAASTIHEPSVLFQLQSEQGVKEVRIPISLKNRLAECSEEQKQTYVEAFCKEREKSKAGLSEHADNNPHQYIQTKVQLLQAESLSPNLPGNPQHSTQTDINSTQPYPEMVTQSSQQQRDPLCNAPPLSTAMYGHQNKLLPVQQTPGLPSGMESLQGGWNQSNNAILQNQTGLQSNVAPVYESHGSFPNQFSVQTVPPQNKPIFEALLSHNPSYQSHGSGQFSGSNNLPNLNQHGNMSLNSNPTEFGQDGNLPNSGLFRSVLEEDCGSFQSNPAEGSTVTGAATADQGRPPQSTMKGRQSSEVEEDGEETKKNKPSKQKTEKHIHYTINVYNANAVQVGNQNMAQSATGGQPDENDDGSEDEESLPINVMSEKRTKPKTMDSAKGQYDLKVSDEGSDNDEQGSNGETEDQQQPMQGSSCNMDAAMSSVGSQPVFNHQIEQPYLHATKEKTITEEESLESSADSALTSQTQSIPAGNQTQAYSENPITTNQLPDGMEKLLNESNLESSVSVEKSSLKDKVIIEDKSDHDEINEKNSGKDLKRQDSRLKSVPVVARVSPMKAGTAPGDSCDTTDVKQVVQSEQTNVKTVERQQDTNRERGECGPPPQTFPREPVQLLTKIAWNCDKDQYNSNVDNTAYGPPVDTSDIGTNEASGNHQMRATFSTHRTRNASEMFYLNQRPHHRVSPVPLGDDPLSTVGSQDGPSEGFTPATDFSETRNLTSDIEYDMCDSDSFEGGTSVSTENSMSHSGRRTKSKGLSANKQCVVS